MVRGLRALGVRFESAMAGDMTERHRELNGAQQSVERFGPDLPWVQAHAIGNAVEQAYRRGDALEKRRKLKEAWASYCEGKR